MVFLRKAALRRPVLFALGALVIVFALMSGAAALIAAALRREISDLVVQISAQVAGALISVFLLWRLGWLGVAGVSTARSTGAWLITVLVLLYASVAGLLSFFGELRLPGPAPAGSGLILVHTTMAGIMEEFLFRGVILLPLAAAWDRPRGRVAAALVSAVLFGLMHIANAFGGELDATLLQISEATLSAILYAALVLRSGSIWPAILLHSVVNLLVNRYAVADPGFVSTASDYLLIVLMDIPLAGLGIYLLAREPNRELATSTSG